MIKINCELCGKIDENLNRALIEGVELNVCTDCSKFGKILAPIKVFSQKKCHEQEKKEEKVELVVENYADIIRKKRESMGLTQKDFASKINEKESVVHKIEIGTFEPSLSLAKNLEKILNMKLIEEHLEKHEVPKKKRVDSFTLGDFIKVNK